MKIRKNVTLDCTYDHENLIPYLLFIKTFKNIARIRNPKVGICGLIRVFSVGFLREYPNPARKFSQTSKTMATYDILCYYNYCLFSGSSYELITRWEPQRIPNTCHIQLNLVNLTLHINHR